MSKLTHQNCTADGKHSPECVIEQLHGRAEEREIDRLERIERTMGFFETDWEGATLIDDCLGE